MKYLIPIGVFLVFVSFATCTSPVSVNVKPEVINDLTVGIWRGALNIGNHENPLEIPFNFEVVNNQKIVIHNGEERIEVMDIDYDQNSYSLSIKMPVFGSEFKLINHKNTWEGKWHNYNKKDYTIPFKAVQNNNSRFAKMSMSSSTTLAHRWKVIFSPDSPDNYPAVGLFDLEKNGKVTGTFLTETGDYRYLEGIFDGHELSLSCFDGAHAFLFKAILQEDGSLKGNFWSGKHWHEQWVATPNNDFQLTSMDKLTYLNEGYDKFAFSFPNEKGDTITLEDERFQNKPVIVQITGFWCPNCMDETRFLVDLYKKYHPKGLEIVAIDYELINDFSIFKKNKKRTEEHLGLNYPVVFGGSASKTMAAKTLPMLNHIMSYPTSIFIDKKGKVREIHTGFSGPGTGELYKKYVDKTINLIETLVVE